MLIRWRQYVQILKQDRRHVSITTLFSRKQNRVLLLRCFAAWRATVIVHCLSHVYGVYPQMLAHKYKHVLIWAGEVIGQTQSVGQEDYPSQPAYPKRNAGTGHMQECLIQMALLRPGNSGPKCHQRAAMGKAGSRVSGSKFRTRGLYENR